MYNQVPKAQQVACGKGTRKSYIFRSVNLYNKNLQSQCNLLAQIEQVQDKMNYPSWHFLHRLVSVQTLQLLVVMMEKNDTKQEFTLMQTSLALVGLSFTIWKQVSLSLVFLLFTVHKTKETPYNEIYICLSISLLTVELSLHSIKFCIQICINKDCLSYSSAILIMAQKSIKNVSGTQEPYKQ